MPFARERERLRDELVGAHARGLALVTQDQAVPKRGRRDRVDVLGRDVQASVQEPALQELPWGQSQATAAGVVASAWATSISTQG